jgi:hypothetical protein
VLLTDVDEGVQSCFGLQGGVLPLLLVHIELHPRHQCNGVDASDLGSLAVDLSSYIMVVMSAFTHLLFLSPHSCLHLLLICFVVLGDLVDVVLVLVLQLVNLEHGLDTGIASFGENAQTDITLVDELVEHVSGEFLVPSLFEVTSYILDYSLGIILQVDADEVLVFYESPTLLNASFHYPHLPFGQLQSLVGLQDVVLHCVLIGSLEGSHHQDRSVVEESLLTHTFYLSQFLFIFKWRQVVGPLDDNWSKFLIGVSHILLFAFRLQDVGHSTHSLDVTLRLFLVDEVRGHLVFDVLLFFLHDVAGILFEDLLLHHSRLVSIVFH